MQDSSQTTVRRRRGRFKVKICQICGKEYQPTSGRQKYCLDCGVQVIAIQNRLKSTRWKKKNPDKVKTIAVAWRTKHPQKAREYHSTRRREHPEEVKAEHFRHRALGFIPLNESFEGCEAHHLDKEYVIHIPEWLHHSVYHNVWTGQGMEKINKLALQWAHDEGL